MARFTAHFDYLGTMNAVSIETWYSHILVCQLNSTKHVVIFIHVSGLWKLHPASSWSSANGLQE